MEGNCWNSSRLLDKKVRLQSEKQLIKYQIGSYKNKTTHFSKISTIFKLCKPRSLRGRPHWCSFLFTGWPGRSLPSSWSPLAGLNLKVPISELSLDNKHHICFVKHSSGYNLFLLFFTFYSLLVCREAMDPNTLKVLLAIELVRNEHLFSHLA